MFMQIFFIKPTDTVTSIIITFLLNRPVYIFLRNYKAQALLARLSLRR
jgi:hypothetical protein